MVAIRALTRVASLSFSKNLSLSVAVDLPSDPVTHQHQLTHENRYMKQTYEVCANTPTSYLSLQLQINSLGQAKLKWSGTGRAIVQVIIITSLYYCNNGCLFSGCTGVSWLQLLSKITCFQPHC